MRFKARADPTLTLKCGQGWINEERWNDEVTISAPHIPIPTAKERLRMETIALDFNGVDLN